MRKGVVRGWRSGFGFCGAPVRSDDFPVATEGASDSFYNAKGFEAGDGCVDGVAAYGEGFCHLGGGDVVVPYNHLEYLALVVRQAVRQVVRQVGLC